MNKLLSIFITLSFIYLSGCTEDTDDLIESLDNACIISEFNDGGDIANFIYNSEYVLESIELSFYETSCSSIGGGPLVCDSTLVKEELQFIYTDEQITSAKLLEDGVISSIDLLISYNDKDQLSKLTFSDDEDGFDYVDEYRFSYNSADQLVKVENFFSNSQSAMLMLNGYETYEYEQNNITKVSYYYENFNNRKARKNQTKFFGNKPLTKSNKEPELGSTAQITYDEKINPFKGNVPYLIYSQSFRLFVNENNPTFFEETSTGEDPSSYSVTYDYIYNNENYPISAVYSYSEDGVNDGKEQASLGYQCE